MNEVMIENGNAPVKVSVSEFRGEQRLDIRHQYDADGDWRPTKRGVNLLLADAPVVVEALRKLEDLTQIVVVDADVRNPVHAYASKYRGDLKLHLRHHYLADDGQWRPTKKGIALPVEMRETLIAAVEEVAQLQPALLVA